jgi:hypothetical protein
MAMQHRKDAHLLNLWNQLEPPKAVVKKGTAPSVDTLPPDEKQ